MTKHKSNIYVTPIIVAVLAALIIFFVTGGVQQTALVGNHAYITSLGDTVTPPGFFQTFLQGTPGSCRVSNTGAYCTATKNTIPLNSLISRDYKAIGWAEYTSCAGFMGRYGCTASACDLADGATCSGSASDNQVLCSYDAQCTTYGSGFSCQAGRCVKQSCTPGTFECNSGELLYCANGNTYSYYSDCLSVTAKTGQCTRNGAIGTSYADLCTTKPADQQTPAEKVIINNPGSPVNELLCKTTGSCGTSEACKDGLCRPVPVIPPIIGGCGGTLAGCGPQPDAGPAEGGACTADYTFLCPDQTTTITTASCVAGLYHLTGQACPDGTVPPTPQPASTSTSVLYAVGAGIVIFGITLWYVRRKNK